MGRRLRPSLPGVPFHITARTQWQEPLFQGHEAAITAVIRDAIDRSDAHLIAYAVMSNHIHLIVRQGRRQLAGFMQPLLRRIALLVIRARQREGHVFAGRFAHSACLDPDYFRSMVAYVHLNPVRAGICRSPEEYAWTSHDEYAHGPLVDAPVSYAHAIERALRVFARRSGRSIRACRHDYRSFLRWRLAMDRYLADESDSWRPVPREPLSLGGDLYWQRQFGTAATLLADGARQPPARPIDLRDYVQLALDDIAPDLPLDLLRAGGHSRPLVRIRRQVIARALGAGYTTIRLATFLNISPSAVSAVQAMLRWRSTP